MASPDDAVLAACKQKLGHFRIKELKDVLHQLGLPKHGKKQELLERVMTVVSHQQNLVPETNGLPKDQEKAVKIVDTFMKMQDPTGTVAASRSHIVSGHNAKPKNKPDDPVKVCCPCGNSKPSISMMKANCMSSPRAPTSRTRSGLVYRNSAEAQAGKRQPAGTARQLASAPPPPERTAEQPPRRRHRGSALSSRAGRI